MEGTKTTPMMLLKEFFGKETAANFECTICIELFNDPQVIKACQHIFCKSCIDEFVKHSEDLSCPNCRHKFSKEDIEPSRFANNLLRELRDRCIIKDKKPTEKTKLKPPKRSTFSIPKKDDGTLEAESMCISEPIEALGISLKNCRVKNRLTIGKKGLTAIDCPILGNITSNGPVEIQMNSEKRTYAEDIRVKNSKFIGKNCRVKQVQSYLDIEIENFEADSLESKIAYIRATNCRFKVDKLIARSYIRFENGLANSLHSSHGQVCVINSIVNKISCHYIASLTKSYARTITLSTLGSPSDHHVKLRLTDCEFKGDLFIKSSEERPAKITSPTTKLVSEPRIVKVHLVGNGIFNGRIHFVDCQGPIFVREKVKANYTLIESILGEG